MPPAAARPISRASSGSETERWARVIKSMDAAKKAESATNN